MLQYLQENTCVGVSLQGFRSATSLKRNTNTDFFKINIVKSLITPILKNIKLL